MDLTDERIERLKTVANNRQQDLTVILENVHDPHNIGAILRTCDSVGIHEVFIVYTDPRLSLERNIEPGKTSSSGSDKWVKVHYFDNVKDCFAQVKKSYSKILATALTQEPRNLYELDLTASTALLFGNESEGLSEEAIKLADGNYLIPQVGFVKSLNISVACAVSVYEAYRQRTTKEKDVGTDNWKTALFERYKEIHVETKMLKREERLQKKLKKGL